MSWQQLLGPEKNQPYFVDTLKQVKQARLAGQVIWASGFTEHVSSSGGGGKGTPRAPTVMRPSRVRWQ